ncbi:hypothetical protein WJ973_12280 [Achromobacter xylosoxidans]
MDVLVALGTSPPSSPAHANGDGPRRGVFRFVTMFVAFPLTARYLELCARSSSAA